MARGAILLLALWTAVPPAASARNPPTVADPTEGVWIGAGEAFIHQSRDRWSVFAASAQVNDLAVDGAVIWLATDDGALRLDTGSRKWSRLGMSEGLPSQVVRTIAVDDQHVWFGTNKGLARQRKHDRRLRIYGEADGLPHAGVNDALRVGRQVWFATRGGLAVYDPESEGLRAFTVEDGLLSDGVEELFQVADDLWCRTDEGLSRLRIRNRTFTNFSFEELGGEELRAFVQDGERVWIGTENGLSSFEASSDSLLPFPQQDALVGRGIVGIEPHADYLFIATEQEVVLYHKLNRSMRRFTEAEGLSRQAGALGTVLSGGQLTLLFQDGAVVYDVQRELWSGRGLAITERDERTWNLRTFGRFNGELPVDLRREGPLADRLRDERFATAEAGLGFGQHFEGGRTLDLSIPLDYGQLELPGVRDLQYRAEYLGAPEDWVREVRVDDKLPYRGLEDGLESPLRLQGAKVRAASPGDEPLLALTAEGGQRRGQTARDFLTGTRQEIYELSHRWVLPGSERVWVDGELLVNGTDYTLIYPSGQLAFLDPERVDDLSVVEAEYEFDLMPKKGLGTLSLLDLLPADQEVGAWVRSGQARLISEESGLYAQIDGAAPKYLDRGWMRSVYAEYRQAGRTIQVAVHDMGSDTNAVSIYDYDLPPAREGIAGRENLVIDLGLATSYAAKAHTGAYFIELSIDEKSDAAKQSLKLFALHVLDREENAGQSAGLDAREWIAAARLATAPLPGLEVGGRLVQLYGVGEGEGGLPARRLLTGVGDVRLERAVGEGGRLTAYGELAGTHGFNQGDPDGFAALGRLRLSHPLLEGSLSARHHDAGYRPLGSDATLFGRLRDEARFSATAYPTRWLPVSAFFTRQHSAYEEGEGQGVVQHALARVQLNREGLPTTSLQVGHSVLDGPLESVSRAKVVGQVDYDLAPLLSFARIQRFSVRALHSISDGRTDASGVFSHGDRVQLSRLEVRLAPTATESAYALFRQRKVERQEDVASDYALGLFAWELNAGARTALVPGLLPQLNYAVFYGDDRLGGAAGLRGAKGALAASVGIYPGQWWAPLAAVVVEPRYAFSSDAAAEGGLRTLLLNVHRFENRAAYAGSGRLELELYQMYEVAFAEADQHVQARNLELRNRIIYRPRHISPLTLRLGYRRERGRNDLLLLPGAPDLGELATWECIGEWLMRWTALLTTRVRAIGALTLTRDLVQHDPLTMSATLLNNDQYRAGGELELRLFPSGDAAQLFLVQRSRVYRLFGQGPGAADAVTVEAAGGAIWTLSDKLYLDGELAWRKVHCLGGTCQPLDGLEPRLLLTFNL